MSLPDPWQHFVNARRARRVERGLERILRPGTRASGTRIIRNSRELVSFAGNDYLGLASHPAVRAAAASCAKEFGVGAGASRLISGAHDLHAQLERRIAAHRGSERCLLFTSGYHVNVGVLSAFADADTLVASDELNHASIIDGCRLSRAKVVVYKHCDYEHARAMLASHQGRRLLVSDTLFSMSGDMANVGELSRVARDTGALLVLDDAHGYGTLGGSGRGVLEEQGLDESAAHIVTATLSKACGSLGGYACGSDDLIELLLNEARPFMFSTAGTLPDISAAMAAIVIIASAEGRALRERLKTLGKRLREGVHRHGFETGGEAHIVPVYIDGPERAVALSRRLEEAGFIAPAIRPPAAPWNRSMLRLCLSAAHDDADIDGLIQALAASSR
ncbi:MAG: 8-amino-7-oxononanoate synthase [Planctomycetes bacterium]|nr:8-amino-7-oxononanoate synthase [Planctomycetota bacterium]NUQ35221.1 8-amino-7-oxononanoate synthase [Planctomycetaceae bacterium]